jgi:hypothetical protein
LDLIEKMLRYEKYERIKEREEMENKYFYKIVKDKGSMKMV